MWSNCQKEGCKTLTSHFISLFKNCGWFSLVTLANFCSHKNLKAHALYYWAVRKYWEVFFHFRIRLFSYLGLHYAMYDLTVLPRWDPALWQGGEVSGAESLAESPQTWTSKLVHMNQCRVCTLCFPDADAGPGTCCYSCRPGTIYKEDENSKHKHVWFWWKKQLTEAQTKHPQRGETSTGLSGCWGGGLSCQVHCPPSLCQTLCQAPDLRYPHPYHGLRGRLDVSHLLTRKLRLRKNNLVA